MAAYLKDQELLKLIEELENEPLYAPPHLQDEIIEKLGLINLTASGTAFKPLKTERKFNTFIYNIKIIAGMAAALFLIFTLPHNIDLSAMNEQIYEHQLEVMKGRNESNTPNEENRLDMFFQAQSAAFSDTVDMFLDKINNFNNLFNRRGEMYED